MNGMRNRKSEQDPNTQRETLSRAYSEMEMEERLVRISTRSVSLNR